jgi:hypothetical protein
MNVKMKGGNLTYLGLFSVREVAYSGRGASETPGVAFWKGEQGGKNRRFRLGLATGS